ncbi:MAG: Nramp family divalent metal transporter [Candidatus Limnocylindrales bacterium]
MAQGGQGGGTGGGTGGRPRRRLPAAPPLGVVSRLRDRVENREFLRLRARFRRRGALAFLAVMGPGLIASLAGNDAGGITTYTVAGSTYGLRLLWLFPLTIITLAVVQEMAARLGVVTGQGLSDLIRDRFGVRWTAFAMLVLLLANVANTMAEFAGVGAASEIVGIPRIVSVPLAAAAIWGLVLFASYRLLERVFLLVSIVFLAYIASAIFAQPDWSAVGRALVTPSLPGSGNELLLMVGLVGTTIAPFMVFYLQSAVAEKGIDEEELRLERADAVGGAIATNVIAVFIVVAAAATLFVAGVTVESAGEAARALGPVAGSFAVGLFSLGLFGASMLAATIVPISTAFVITEAFGWESGVGRRFRDARAFYILYSFVLFVPAMVVLLPSLDLVRIILASQYLQGLLLPIVLIFMLRLVNDRRLLGRYINGRWRNVLAVAAIGLVILLDVALLGTGALELVGLRLFG